MPLLLSSGDSLKFAAQVRTLLSRSMTCTDSLPSGLAIHFAHAVQACYRIREQVPADEEVNGAFVRAADDAVNDGDVTRYMRGKEATVPSLCSAWSPSSRRFSTALDA